MKKVQLKKVVAEAVARLEKRRHQTAMFLAFKKAINKE